MLHLTHARSHEMEANHFLNKNMMLVDCPGLVFPAVDMPKQLQILCDIFPIAQVREPFSAIQYMAKYVPIENVYRLNLEDAPYPVKYDPAKDEIPWSAWMICEAYAHKRGYHTRRGLNVHRAGLEILFDVIDGRVVLYFLPNQTTISLGAYTDPDGKICHPLLPNLQEESSSLEQLPTLTSTEDSNLSTNTEMVQKKAKLVAVANPRADQPGTGSDEDHPNDEKTTFGTDKDCDEDLPSVGKNPFDVLG